MPPFLWRNRPWWLGGGPTVPQPPAPPMSPNDPMRALAGAERIGPGPSEPSDPGEYVDPPAFGEPPADYGPPAESDYFKRLLYNRRQPGSWNPIEEHLEGERRHEESAFFIPGHDYSPGPSGPSEVDQQLKGTIFDATDPVGAYLREKELTQPRNISATAQAIERGMHHVFEAPDWLMDPVRRWASEYGQARPDDDYWSAWRRGLLAGSAEAAAAQVTPFNIATTALPYTRLLRGGPMAQLMKPSIKAAGDFQIGVGPAPSAAVNALRGGLHYGNSLAAGLAIGEGSAEAVENFKRGDNEAGWIGVGQAAFGALGAAGGLHAYLQSLPHARIEGEDAGVSGLPALQRPPDPFRWAKGPDVEAAGVYTEGEILPPRQLGPGAQRLLTSGQRQLPGEGLPTIEPPGPPGPMPPAPDGAAAGRASWLRILDQLPTDQLFARASQGDLEALDLYRRRQSGEAPEPPPPGPAYGPEPPPPPVPPTDLERLLGMEPGGPPPAGEVQPFTFDMPEPTLAERQESARRLFAQAGQDEFQRLLRGEPPGGPPIPPTIPPRPPLPPGPLRGGAGPEGGGGVPPPGRGGPPVPGAPPPDRFGNQPIGSQPPGPAPGWKNLTAAELKRLKALGVQEPELRRLDEEGEFRQATAPRKGVPPTIPPEPIPGRDIVGTPAPEVPARDPLAELMGTVERNQNIPVEHLAEDLAVDVNQDALTGAGNRRAWERAQQQPGRLFGRLDIDNFKALNDTLGHDAGDRALQIVTEVLNQFTRRQGDAITVFRPGGDEFGLAIEHPGSPEAVTKLRDAIEGEIARRFQEAGLGEAAGKQLGASLGFADKAWQADQAQIARKKERGISQPRGGVSATQPPGPPAGGAPGVQPRRPVRVGAPSGPPSLRPTTVAGQADRLWPEYLASARVRGNNQPSDELRAIFDARVERAGRLIEEMQALEDESGGRALIRAIQQLGGIRPFDFDTIYTLKQGGTKRVEMRGDWEQLVQMFQKAGIVGGSSPWRRTGHGADKILQGLAEMPQFAHLAGDPEALKAELYAIASGQRKSNVPTLESVLNGPEQMPIDSRWWEEGGPAAAPEPAPAVTGEVTPEAPLAPAKPLAEMSLEELQARAVAVEERLNSLDPYSEEAARLGDEIETLIAETNARAAAPEPVPGPVAEPPEPLAQLLGTETPRSLEPEIQRLSRELDAMTDPTTPEYDALLRELNELVREQNRRIDAETRPLAEMPPDEMFAEIDRMTGRQPEGEPGVDILDTGEAQPRLLEGEPGGEARPLAEAPTGEATAAAREARKRDLIQRKAAGTITRPEEIELDTLVGKRAPTQKQGGMFAEPDELDFVAGEGSPLEDLLAPPKAAVEQKPLAELPEGEQAPQPPPRREGERRVGDTVAYRQGAGQRLVTGEIISITQSEQFGPIAKVRGKHGIETYIKVRDLQDAPVASQPGPPQRLEDVLGMTEPEGPKDLLGRPVEPPPPAPPAKGQHPLQTIIDALRSEDGDRILKEMKVHPAAPHAGQGATAFQMARLLESSRESKWLAAAKGVQDSMEAGAPGRSREPAIPELEAGAGGGKPPEPPEPPKPVAAPEPPEDPLQSLVMRHGVEAPEKVEKIGQSMARVGWKGRPALIVKDGDTYHAWTATHRLEAAKAGGLTWDQVPKVVVDAQALRDAGYDFADITGKGKGKRIQALRDAGLEEAAQLLDDERQGSKAREEVHEGAADVEDVDPRVREFLVRQLKYTNDEVTAMGWRAAKELGEKVRLHPEGVQAGIKEFRKAQPARGDTVSDELADLLNRKEVWRESDILEGMKERGREMGLTRAPKGPGELAPPRYKSEAMTRAMQMTEDYYRTRSPRTPEGVPIPPEGRKVTQSEAATAGHDMVRNARRMAKLLEDPTPENLDEYARLLGEQADRQFRREDVAEGAPKPVKTHERTGEYLASGLGGLEKLWQENPALFWRLMRTAGGSMVGALLGEDEEHGGDPLTRILLGGAAGYYGPSILRAMRGKAPGVAKALKELIPPYQPSEPPAGGVWPARPPRDFAKDIGGREMYAFAPAKVVPDVWAKISPTLAELDAVEKQHPSATPRMVDFTRKMYLKEAIADIRGAAQESKGRGHHNRARYLEAMVDELLDAPTVTERFFSNILSGWGEGRKLTADEIRTGREGGKPDGRRLTQEERFNQRIPQRVTPKQVGTFFSKIEKYTYLQLLGLALDTGLINRTQVLLAVPHIGWKGVMQGKRLAKTEAGKRATEFLDIPTPADAPFSGAVGRMKPGMARKIVDFMLSPLRIGDIKNRQEAYLGAKDFAQKRGLTDAQAHEWAMEITGQTQSTPGELGNNPFHRQFGPLRMFTKYPATWASLVDDLVRHPDPGVRRRGLGMMLGVTGAAGMVGVNALSFLFPAARVAAPALAGVKDIADHVMGDSDHPLSDDVNPFSLDSKLWPRYGTKVVKELRDLGRYGFGEHPEFDKGGSRIGAHSAYTGVLNLLGLQTFESASERAARTEAYEFSAKAQQNRRRVSQQHRKALRDAIESSDWEEAMDAMRDMTPQELRYFYQQNRKTPYQHYLERIPKADRPEFERRFRGRLEQ